MKEQLKTVYTCDHCKKKLFIKSAMVKHEEFCDSSPLNKPKCADCKFCDVVDKEIFFDTFSGESSMIKKAFRCSAREIGIYPLKVVRTDLINRYPETFEGEILMPIECDSYKGLYDFEL